MEGRKNLAKQGKTKRAVHAEFDADHHHRARRVFRVQPLPVL